MCYKDYDFSVIRRAESSEEKEKEEKEEKEKEDA